MMLIWFDQQFQPSCSFFAKFLMNNLRLLSRADVPSLISIIDQLVGDGDEDEDEEEEDGKIQYYSHS